MSAQVTPVRGKRLVLDSQKVGGIVGDAMMRGKADGLFSPVIDYSYGCEAPVYLDLHGKGYLDHPSGKYRHGRGATLRTPCRRCAPCLTRKSNLWAGRAINELRLWPRTWFGTMTLSPQCQFVARVLAGQATKRRRGEALSDLHESARLQALVNAIYPELNKWMKRIRKESGATIRYLLVAEPHKSGDPHFHCLLHEAVGAVRKRTLESQWVQGFSHWRLVDNSNDASVWYACKYLAKYAGLRPYASSRYGQPEKAIVGLLAKRPRRSRESATASIPPFKDTKLSPSESGGVSGFPVLKDEGLKFSVLEEEILKYFPNAQYVTEKEELWHSLLSQ